MSTTTHLRSLQALEMAIRSGSLKDAAGRLGITAAAVGQRIRALEDYLGTDLIVRGRSGLLPTPELGQALGDLHAAFAALDRVTQSLDFQRASEIQIVAEPDWAELWLEPRVPAFRAAYPNIRFCINGVGDIPLRLGAPDIRVYYGSGPDEALYTDVLLPISGLDNLRRVAGNDPALQLEGMPLLHLKPQLEKDDCPGWVEWCARYGHRLSGTERGLRYPHLRLALEAVREDVGYLVCGLSLVQRSIDAGNIVALYPLVRHVPAPHPYRLNVRGDLDKRPQLQRFVAWLRSEAKETRQFLETQASGFEHADGPSQSAEPGA